MTTPAKMNISPEVASREAFEAWIREPDSPVPAGVEWASLIVDRYWRCWQASRRAPDGAREDAPDAEEVAAGAAWACGTLANIREHVERGLPVDVSMWQEAGNAIDELTTLAAKTEQGVQGSTSTPI
jgi:hypothetical protein